MSGLLSKVFCVDMLYHVCAAGKNAAAPPGATSKRFYIRGSG